MDINELIAEINRLSAELAALKGVPVTAPLVAVNPLYAVDDNKLLVHCRWVGGSRIDPVVGVDCANTAMMVATGHVLSNPRPDLGENLMGYVSRVADQCHGDQNRVGTLAYMTAPLYAKFGTPAADGANWSRLADMFYNQRFYMSSAELAEDNERRANWGLPPVPPFPFTGAVA
jgi:hypothetical protein